MECCAACREPLDPNDRPPVWPCCLARGHSACYGAASTCPACGAPARLADAVTPGAYDGDDESSLDDPPSLIEELESARKRAMDDDARVREEVSALKAALRRSESSLNEEVEKREAAERELHRVSERRPSTPSEIRNQLEGVKAAARSAFGAVRALRARSPVESDPERAFYAREDRRAAASRLDVAERSLAPDASPSERAAARLDAAEPVLRPAASP